MGVTFSSEKDAEDEDSEHKDIFGARKVCRLLPTHPPIHPPTHPP